MFSVESIQLLQQGAAITQAAESIAEAITSTANTVALPNDYQLHDLEKLLPQRRRARGTMSTTSLPSFAEYVLDHAEAGASVFVDAIRMQATAVLNLGGADAPGHCDNRAVLTAQATAAYKALLAIANGMQIKQATLAEYLEDWGHMARCETADGTELEVRKAAAGVRSITIEGLRRVESAEQQLGASRSAFEEVKAAKQDTIPAFITITCDPYQGLQPRSLRCRLGIVTSADKPALTLRIAKHEEHDEEMAQELAQLVRGALTGTSLPVLVGSYSLNG